MPRSSIAPALKGRRVWTGGGIGAGRDRIAQAPKRADLFRQYAIYTGKINVKTIRDRMAL
jgi:hypothetical protein